MDSIDWGTTVVNAVWKEVKAAAIETPALYFAPLVGAIKLLGRLADNTAQAGVQVGKRHAVVQVKYVERATKLGQKHRFAKRKQTIEALAAASRK